RNLLPLLFPRFRAFISDLHAPPFPPGGVITSFDSVPWPPPLSRAGAPLGATSLFVSIQPKDRTERDWGRRQDGSVEETCRRRAVHVFLEKDEVARPHHKRRPGCAGSFVRHQPHTCWTRGSFPSARLEADHQIPVVGRRRVDGEGPGRGSPQRLRLRWHLCTDRVLCRVGKASSLLGTRIPLTSSSSPGYSRRRLECSATVMAHSPYIKISAKWVKDFKVKKMER
ncbi:uncharacterized protein LOC119468347, partial [Cebus imitator]